MYSMTGFATHEKKISNIKWSMKISAINSKFLDMRIDGLRDLYLQDKVRNILKNELSRGKITLYIKYETVEEEKGNWRIDDNIVKTYLKESRRIAKKFSLHGESDLLDILGLSDAWIIKNDDNTAFDTSEKELEKMLLELLVKLKKNRFKEGQNLYKKFGKYLKELTKNAAKLEIFKKEHEEQLKKKIELKLLEFDMLDDSKKTALERELHILLLKGDFEEELVRVDAHLKHFLDIIEKDEPIGKKMGFMVQELNREFNTLGDKITSVKGKQLAIESKLIVDRIREQALNIE
ncbi:MAG: DUF1732 domain-containing protein [bacterium]|nr:DUF1732 domain-containing protein [bacterium]